MGVAHSEKATQLLLESTRGDADATDALFPLIYDHLRSLARSLFRWSRAAQTLDPTELVHETYLKLIRHGEIRSLERTHFFRLAARALRPPRGKAWGRLGACEFDDRRARFAGATD
jgi:DNA-directed RNA polymerase specialized sigma24 family protein